MHFPSIDELLELDVAVHLELLRKYWYLPLLLLGAVRVVYDRWFSPLSKFPGPFLAHVSGLYAAWASITLEMEKVEFDLHKKYGAVVRYMPHCLLVSDPKMLPTVFHRSADKDPSFYGAQGLGGGVNVFTCIPHVLHTKLRKRIAPNFSLTNIRSMEPLIDNITLKFQAKMDRFAETGETFDFALWSHFLPYDIFSELLFGKAIGFIENEKNIYNLVGAGRAGFPMASLMSRLPVLNAILGSKLLAWLAVPKPTDKSGFGAMMGYRDRLLRERFGKQAFEKGGAVSDDHGQKDFLHSIISSKNADGSLITLNEVREEIFILMVGGSDTTASTLRQVISRVVQHPDCYERVTREIDSAYASGKLSVPVVKYEEASTLPLLCATIKETLRLDPSAPVIMPRVAGKGGYHLNGLFVPEGTAVGANPWTTGRNHELYGPDAEKWRPERWLEAGPEKAKEFEKYDLSFGYGPRLCLGKNLSLFELHKELCQFFLHYKVELVDLEKHGRRVNVTLTYQQDMWMRLHKRKLPARNI